MGIISSINGIGEQKVMLDSRKLMGTAQKGSRMLEKVLKGDQNLDRLHELKSQSYEEVFNLSNSITSGAISPNLIPDMLQLIGLEYKVVDMIFVLSRSLTRYRIRNPGAKRYVNEKISASNELVAKAISAIYLMHTEDKIDSIKRLRNQVKLIEEQGDEIKEDLLKYAYGKKMDYKEFYHVTNLAYISDDVLDACEDAADMLMNIMLAIAT